MSTTEPCLPIQPGGSSLEIEQLRRDTRLSQEADVTLSSNKDIEQAHSQPERPDIEHEAVEDDPRLWSPAFKWALVGILSAGALIPTMAANIYFPVINDLKEELHASDGAIALSVSLYILAQGGLPLVWSPLSEVFGRKICFLCATAIFAITSFIIAAATQNMATLIALRVIGAGGSSAMLAIAAGTIADLYEPAERGIKVGIYYCCPLLGPALGPIFGGALGSTGRGSWRLTFYFIASLASVSFLSFVFFFKETFRTERSLAWQKAKRLALEKAAATHSAENSNTWWERMSNSLREAWTSLLGHLQRKRQDGDCKGDDIIDEGKELSPRPFNPPSYESAPAIGKSITLPTSALHDSNKPFDRDIMMRATSLNLTRKTTTRLSINRTITVKGKEIKFRPALSDVSPIGSAVAVLKQPHNIISLLYSGLGFASVYSISYTATRTFSAPPYNFPPILIGVVLLALGIGGMAGSILGGRLSDRALRIEAERKSDIKPAPELRIMSVRLPMLLCPPSFVGYAWSAYYKTNIAIPIVCLILLGFSLFWIYSSTLSYLIDSNVGRSSGAVACNSATRGLLAFVASEVAGPLQDSIGDGALYTGWAVLLATGQVALIVVAYKGKQWRDPSWRWPRFYTRKADRIETGHIDK